MKNKISCKICGQKLDVINSNHLRKHEFNFKKYKTMFPNAEILSPKLRKTLREKSWSIQSLPKINEKRKIGIRNWMRNNPEKVKQRTEIQKGKPKHTLETRRKISLANKGKHSSIATEFKKGHKIPREWIESMRQKKIGIPSKKKGKTYFTMYGEEKAKEIINRQSKSHQNKKLSEAHKKSMSLAHKQKFLNDENFKKEFGKRFNRKPNKPEKQLIKLINENGFLFKYTGDYSFWVSNKNPDFINSEGKSQVIELLSTYWHKKRKNIHAHQTHEGTIKHYKKFGFSCLIIWDYELKRPEKVVQKIKEFTQNNQI